MLGADVKTLEAGETVKQLASGELDGAEFNNLSTDRAIGLPKSAKFCMLQSVHEGSGILEFMINSKIWESLSQENRKLIETVASAMFAETSWYMADANSKDYDEMVREGITFLKTPATIIQAQINAWDTVIAEKSAKDPLFAKVVKSQRDYARRITRWSTDVELDPRTVYRHYFSRRVV